MRRVKDYRTYLNESWLTGSDASKIMTKIIKGEKRKIKPKEKSEIDPDLSDSGVSINTQWEYDEDYKGFLGSSPLFGGEVVLRELSEEDIDVETKEYEVISGLNKGKRGNFEWKDEGGTRYPVFDKPYNSSFTSLLGYSEEFLKTYKDNYRWKTPIPEIPGAEIVKKGDKGECEIHYKDIYQLYGKIRIYYDSNSEDPYLSYEVLDGPNSGKRGSGVTFMQPGQFNNSGVLNAFSDQNSPKFLSSEEFPFYPADISDKDYSGFVSRKNRKWKSLISTTGMSTAQYIYFSTKGIDSIEAPSEEVFESMIESVEPLNTTNQLPRIKADSRSGGGGIVNKSQYKSTDLFSSGIPEKTTSTLEDLKIKGNKWPGAILHCFPFLNDIALYAVPCKRSENPKLNFNSDLGVYGNLYFSGRFLVNPKEWKILKGEWYIDYSTKSIGIIYAFDEQGKYADIIYDPESKYPNHYSLF
jgi:hypothetical protein